MSRFMLFCPGARDGDGPKLVERFELEPLERDGALSWLASKGPGDVEGLLGGWLAIDPQLASVVYQPARQTWQKCPGRELWIGTENARPVKPQDLERSVCRGGREVLLADGNRWLIPVARWLPHDLGIDEFRQPTRVPKREYADFCRQAELVLESLLANSDPETGRIKCEVDWDFVCATLAMNYLVTPDVVNALRLFDDRSGIEAMATVCDFQAIAEVVIERQKKTEAESADIGAT